MACGALFFASCLFLEPRYRREKNESQANQVDYFGFDIKPTFFKCSTTLTVTFTLSKKKLSKIVIMITLGVFTYGKCYNKPENKKEKT